MFYFLSWWINTILLSDFWWFFCAGSTSCTDPIKHQRKWMESVAGKRRKREQWICERRVSLRWILILSSVCLPLRPPPRSASMVDMRGEEEAVLRPHSQARHELMHSQYSRMKEEEDHWQDVSVASSACFWFTVNLCWTESLFLHRMEIFLFWLMEWKVFIQQE